MVLDATTCDRGGIGAIPQPPDPGEPPWSWDRVGVDHSTPTASRVTKTQRPRSVEVDRLVTVEDPHPIIRDGADCFDGAVGGVQVDHDQLEVVEGLGQHANRGPTDTVSPILDREYDAEAWNH